MIEERIPVNEVEEKEKYEFWINSNRDLGGVFTVKVRKIREIGGKLESMQVYTEENEKITIYWPNAHAEMRKDGKTVSMGRLGSVYPEGTTE